MFRPYGDILSVFMRSPDPQFLEKLPDEKRQSILQHQFAFITFKDFESASRVVNEFSYLTLNDKKYNDEIIILVENIKKLDMIEIKYYM